MSIIYNTILPVWEPGQKDDKGFLRSVEGKPIWSNENPPPPIGARVKIRVNGIGMATVESYFEQDGFLGVFTRVDEWPKQWDGFRPEGDKSCHAFGAEILYPLPVAITCERGDKIEVVHRTATVADAEEWIAVGLADGFLDEDDVEQGTYGIDAPEEMVNP